MCLESNRQCKFNSGTDMATELIGEIILSNEVDDYVKDLIKKERLVNVKVKTDEASSKGNNFLGIVSRVIISGEREGKLTTLYLFVKLPVSDEALQNKYSVSPFFKREIFMYNNVLKLYEELQESVVPAEEKLIFPKCHFTNQEKSKECVVLEDLKQKGYEICDKMKPVDLDHCLLVMEALGKLHALSFVIQRTAEKQFEYFVENTQDILMSQSGEDKREESLKYMSMRVSEAVAVLDNDDEKKKLEPYGEKLLDFICESIKPRAYSVITHGDCWMNNAMFRYKDGKPTDVCLIDYQISRYASPALDIHYFIWHSFDHVFRRSHYDYVLKIYYDSLTRHLKYHYMDVSEVFPHHIFLEHVKTHAIYGIGSAILNLPIILRDEAEVVNLADLLEESRLVKLNTCEAFKTRIQGLVKDAVLYEYL